MGLSWIARVTKGPLLIYRRVVGTRGRIQKFDDYGPIQLRPNTVEVRRASSQWFTDTTARNTLSSCTRRTKSSMSMLASIEGKVCRENTHLRVTNGAPTWTTQPETWKVKEQAPLKALLCIWTGHNGVYYVPPQRVIYDVQRRVV